WLLSLISGLTARRAAPRLLRLSLTVLRRLALLRRRRASGVPRVRRGRRVRLALTVQMALRVLRATRATLARMGPTASRPRHSGTNWLPASKHSKRPRRDMKGVGVYGDAE